MASNNNVGQQQNIEITNVIGHLEQTTEILKSFGENIYKSDISIFKKKS